MKKIAYSIFALLLIAGTTRVLAQAEETRQVSGYRSIASSGPFDMRVKIDGTESLKISGRSEILKEIETVVEDGKLEIRFKHHYNWNHSDAGKEGIRVYITAKSISALANAGSGSIAVDGTVSGSNVSITLSGSGNINSAVKSTDLHASISGSGSLNLKGSADNAKIAITGSGQINGRDLRTGSASVLITGSGNATFDAGKTITARIVGSGNVSYTGSATVTDVKTVGSGRVSKAD